MYDFRGDAVGIAIPYGVYDVGRGEGFVNVGTSHDTPAFASLLAWWQRVGRRQYPGAQRLLIEADGGGSNGTVRRLWHTGLQAFADRTGLVVRMAHYPTGASKWNPIEHRLFSQISRAWAGRPLTSYEVVLKTLGSTRTTTGLRCRAQLDGRAYPTGLQPTAEQKARLRLRRPKTLAAWNDTITPNRRPPGQLISLQPLSGYCESVPSALVMTGLVMPRHLLPPFRFAGRNREVRRRRPFARPRGAAPFAPTDPTLRSA
jgi:Rhodopirellula transposase DDE domain